MSESSAEKKTLLIYNSTTIWVQNNFDVQPTSAFGGTCVELFLRSTSCTQFPTRPFSEERPNFDGMTPAIDSFYSRTTAYYIEPAIDSFSCLAMAHLRRTS
jgi:hypothetical protein